MKRHTVMAVDDVEINLDTLEGILEDTYNVIKIDGGAGALKILDGGANPDLILLDLSMPEMDGFEFLGKIRENEKYSGIPVIFVTGYDDVYSEEKGLSLGAVDYIKKPYEPNIIRVKIRNHIELKTYRDNLSEAVAERTRQLEERTEELSATHGAVIMGMSLLAESRDKVTGAHLLRIKALTRIVAQELLRQHPEMLDEEMVDLFAIYSPLHDIGKVGIPDAILTKKGKLTDEEFEQMKAHSRAGGDILRTTSEFLPSSGMNRLGLAIEIAENHHERFDGTGYPERISGEEIPLAARIVSVVDVYDALRSPRPYKRNFSHEESMDIILKGDGRTEPAHFDPRVLKAFEATQEKLRDAYDSNPDPHIAE